MEKTFNTVEEARSAHEELVQNIQSIENQLSTRRTESEVTGNREDYLRYLVWRPKALAAKKHLRSRLVATKSWIREYNKHNGGVEELLSKLDVVLHEAKVAGTLLVEIHDYLGTCAVEKVTTTAFVTEALAGFDIEAVAAL